MALARGCARLDLESTGVWLLLAGAVLAAAVTIPTFRDPANLVNVLRQSSVLGILAIGQTFVIAAGMLDLSIGMLTGLVVVLACWLLEADPSIAYTLAVAAMMILLGASVGLVNGTLVNRLKLHPLILTFGMLSILQGLIFTFTDRSVGSASPLLQSIANDSLWGIPLSTILLAVVLVLSHLAFTRTRFGYHLVAAGGNPESARRAGINVAAIRLACFVISGAFAGLAGLLLAGRLGTGYPLAGSGLELDAIVAVVLGGTALAGGRGSVVRSIAGVLALAIISNVLNLLGVSAFVQMFVKGLIVVVAILVNQPRRENP
ncbi:ABC transporter permease [Oceanibacterium hippocampi]|uniref:Autoinducer 2 import system permease protein LsrD n=1 Tax=Oceanibacterium hippocampi TaxID=745714 RepID=A0A1Y5TN79_9PROT|nr:ABC transporter permease [Oceanibacterium hippocampi]SLN64191.1 Ribose transport system permease protein RbsC [Oceanibacterium hippocampi]